MSKSRVILHGFWASSCSWRVRAALHHKGILYEEKFVDIVNEKRHLTTDFRTINPSQKVPALEIDGVILVESMAILQYLEDTHPQPSLTPSAPLLRARMREIVETIVSGIQPLQNVGLRSQFDSSGEYEKFCRHWTERGLQTLEVLLQKTAGTCCVGDQITMADLCLVPQVLNAVTRLKLEVSALPTVSRLYHDLLKHKLFMETHPRNFKPKL